jgi:orotate phosphoribosyltransferase
MKYYEREGAVWFYNYNGDPKAPHAKITSGLCSDGYVNSAPVLCRPNLTELLAPELSARVDSAVSRLGVSVDWVVGSPYAAITFSYELARQLDARHGFAEKDPKNPKQMIWNPSRFSIPADSVVLQCEELITTLGTTMEVREAIQKGNPNAVRLLPFVATAVHRPAVLDGCGPVAVIALIEKEIKSWQPTECLLYKQGSEPLRPREGQNWAKFTGKAA